MSQPGQHLTLQHPITCTLPQENSALSPSNQSSLTTPSLPSSTDLTPAPSDKEVDSSHGAHLMPSARQPCPRLPITYNVASLMKLHGRPQIRTLNSVSIPLPFDDRDQEESSMMTDCEDTATESPTRPSSTTTRGVTNDSMPMT